MGAVSHFSVELALPFCTSEGGRWYSYLYSVLVGRSQRKATSVPAKSARRVISVDEDQKKIASYIQYFSRQRAKQEVAYQLIY